MANIYSNVHYPRKIFKQSIPKQFPSRRETDSCFIKFGAESSTVDIIGDLCGLLREGWERNLLVLVNKLKEMHYLRLSDFSSPVASSGNVKTKPELTFSIYFYRHTTRICN